MLHRRDLLKTTGSAALALAASAACGAAQSAKKRILVFTRSQGFQHDVVKVIDSRPCLVDIIFGKLAAKHNFEIECTKDGRVFSPENLAKFDAFFFYTTGNLTAEKSADNTPPMSHDGKKALLDSIAAGKGFLGSHCASDTFHSPGNQWKNQDPKDIDPYIKMLGGEFISHGDQQKSEMHVTDPHFPGLEGVRDFTLNEEWYSLRNFQKDLHVLLVQETKGMRNAQYQRPKYPATWARRHGKGRVFYTSMGHRNDVWDNPLFQTMLAGAINWATGRVDADTSPNIDKVAPEAMTMPIQPATAPKKK